MLYNEQRAVMRKETNGTEDGIKLQMSFEILKKKKKKKGKTELQPNEKMKCRCQLSYGADRNSLKMKQGALRRLKIPKVKMREIHERSHQLNSRAQVSETKWNSKKSHKTEGNEMKLKRETKF